MKIKTSELTGVALDWVVAKCEGKVEQGVYGTPRLWNTGLHLHYCAASLGSAFSPSTDWSQGGPIIEREGFEIRGKVPNCYANYALGKTFHGPTTLVAAMRCLVASKLGEEVEIPEELAP